MVVPAPGLPGSTFSAAGGRHTTLNARSILGARERHLPIATRVTHLHLVVRAAKLLGLAAPFTSSPIAAFDTGLALALAHQSECPRFVASPHLVGLTAGLAWTAFSATSRIVPGTNAGPIFGAGYLFSPRAARITGLDTPFSATSLSRFAASLALSVPV